MPDQRAVAQLKLDPVKTALDHMAGAPGKIGGAFLDILDLHGLAGLPKNRVLPGRGPPDRPAGILAVGLQAVVVQLGEYPGVVVVDDPGQFPEPGNGLRIKGIHQFLVGLVGGMDG